MSKRVDPAKRVGPLVLCIVVERRRLNVPSFRTAGTLLNAAIRSEDVAESYHHMWDVHGDTYCWAHVLAHGHMSRAERLFAGAVGHEQKAVAESTQESVCYQPNYDDSGCKNSDLHCYRCSLRDTCPESC
jgi:hypothetical protein